MPVIYLGMGFLFGESGIPLSSRLYLTQVLRARKQLYNYPPAIQKRAIERGIVALVGLFL